MHRLLIFVFLILHLGLTALALDSPATRITEHRAWMRANFPGKDASLEDKLKGIVDMLDFDLQEIGCLVLMEYMREDCKDFAPYTENLEGYIKNHGTNAIDDLGKWKRGAIGYFTEFAKSKLGVFHPLSVRLRLMQIEVESSYYDCGAVATAFSDSLYLNYKKNPAQINLKMATVGKVQAFCVRSAVKFACSREDYLEIMRLEKEVLATFPARSEEIDLWRANAYLMMGDAKSMIDDGEKFDVTTMGTEFEMKVIPDNGTEYSTLGKNRDVISNVPWYFLKAEEIVEKLYSPSHPATNIFVFRVQSFDSNNFAVDEELTDALNDTYTYFKLYYPENNLNAMSVRVDSWFKSIAFNKSNHDLVNIDKVLPIFMRIFGKDNPKYISNLLVLTVISEIISPQSGRLEKTIVENAANESLTQIQKDLNSFYLYNQLYSVNSESVKNSVSMLAGRFMQTEENSYEAADLGYKLADFYIGFLNDYVTACNINDKVQQILLKCDGVSSPFFQLELFRYISLAVGKGGKDALESINMGLGYAHKANVSYRKYFENKYKILELDYNYFSKRDFIKCEELARGIIKEMSPEEADVKSVKTRLANSIFNQRGKTEESEQIMADLLSQELETDAIARNINVLDGITQYYLATYQPTEAQKAINAAQDASVAMTGGFFDDVYMYWRELQAETFRMLGDKNARRRIFSEDLDMLENNPLYVPTVSLLNYIWAGYYAAKQDNQGDFNLMNYFIQKFSKYMLPLYNSTSDKESFELDYYVPLMVELIDMILYWKNSINSYVLENYPREYYSGAKDGCDNLLEQINILKGPIEEKLASFSCNLHPYRKMNISRLLLGLSRLADEIDNDKEEAEKYLQSALDFAYNDNEIVANVESSRAEFYRKYGEWDKAVKSFEVSVAEVKKRSYSSFEDKKFIPYFYFCYHKENGNYVDAIKNAKDFYQVMKDELDTQFQLMTVTDQENFMSQHGDPVSLMSIILEHAPEKLAGDVYDGLIYRTGMQLRSQQSTLRAIESSDDAELKGLVEELNGLRGEQARQNQMNPTNDETLKATERIRKMRRIEQQIFDLTADARKDVTKTVGWDDVRDALAEGEAAIEFAFSDNHIMALILKPGCKSPACVRLAKHSELEEYLKSVGAKNSAALAKKLYGSGMTKLYELLWSPMEQELKDVKTIYLSAPGVLNSISFNAMSTPDGGYIFDKYDIRQLTTTAELVKEHDDSAPRSALLAGEILFTPSQKSQVGKMDAATREVDMEYALDDFDQRGVTRQYFRYLPYTGVEIDDIGKSLKGLNPKFVRRGEATESELRKQFASEYDVLHLATHGFFLASDVEAYKVPYMKRHSGNIGSSMQRAGIALAGAEDAWKGAELPDDNDGILTALELSNMNLKGTKLAVLSACETALGNYSFEGVYGLPRGLKQAGVQKLMVSLWSVNDHSTSLFMSKFYETWICGSTPHEAYRAAVEAVRDKYPEPFHWAPFILLDGK